ncbi:MULTISPECIES: NAD(P)H-hydrate dehydratase [Lactobacillus]|uniref:ADP-dependent (S)-NAD(P)H-hydrate dehydratase n=1 Tax=Lactobacillus xujianguonis TaxID=2495899 RepID=A0A437SUV9_9LACO|nr:MULTISPECIES: NAD(P)H-hydrate dehydratase [Lactobacillus]RVU70597.1 NAD(P)H-hydrate dehydratase [Lactobacillus xujianguonis]RVU73778.1 NAD(P)H-hydrate dehydratase [Lactobacillus xujianguonis]
MPTEISEKILSEVIKTRKSATHKGNYGRILLIGGSDNYGGAIIMATEGAINVGAGLTAVATHSVNLTALHARDPEAMFIDWHDKGLPALIKKMDVIVCGPGLGMSTMAQQLLKILKENVTAKQTVVLDASALDLVAQDKNFLPSNAGHLVLTPHQMEWQRVSQLRIPFQTDQANLTALKQLVPQGNVTLILKSNHTHVYGEDGSVFINPIGNPGMATGGMGDTLAGIVGGMIAQFGPDLKTILAAVYLHSYAGDQLYEDNYVVKPTALSQSLPKIMKKYATSLEKC